MTNTSTILVVDDELESLRLLTNILQADGYHVRPADTGEMALESVQEKAPDLILLDVRLPGLGGFEVCQRLKAHPETRAIPLMFISKSHEVEKRVEGLQLGAVDFISKPFRSAELLARVRTHLELGRLRIQLEKRAAERAEELLVANRQLRLELTEHRLAEQALRETEERFRNMADTAPVLIWVSGPDKLCKFFNKPWLDFTGRSMEQELGEGWAAGVHSDDLDRCYHTYCSSFDARRRFEMEYRLRRADGEYRWILDTGVPRFEPGGMFAGYIGSCIDITDFKLNQEQMLARQKLESLGVLAAGIAHDFNNMLGSIFAEADLAFAELPPDSDGRSNLDRICAVTIRASEVVNLLMAYAGGTGDDESFEAVDLSSLVQEMLAFLKVSISKKAVLKTSFAKGCPPIYANPTQIRRVVMNLVTNASEALGDNEGSILASTDCIRITGAHFEDTAALSEGDYGVLEISDTGRGMNEQSQAKAFDPFYTTKSVGRGLGLSAVQGIVRSHGGAIRVASVPGKGCTFRVFIPSARELREKRRIAVVAAAEEPARKKHTVLLVEDEDTLRLAVSMSLQKNGFSVVAAADGQAALNLFRELSPDIDLILLDVTLPAMSGPEVFREVRRLSPDTKIILTSAYDWAHIRASFGECAFGEEALFGFIRKPYRIGELLRILRETLRQAQTVRRSTHI